MPILDDKFSYSHQELKVVEYKDLDPDSLWQEFAMHYKITDKDIERFSNYWNALVR